MRAISGIWEEGYVNASVNNKLPEGLNASNIAYKKYAPINIARIEGSCLMYKNIPTNNRRKFISIRLY